MGSSHGQCWPLLAVALLSLLVGAGQAQTSTGSCTPDTQRIQNIDSLRALIRSEVQAEVDAEIESRLPAAVEAEVQRRLESTPGQEAFKRQFRKLFAFSST